MCIQARAPGPVATRGPRHSNCTLEMLLNAAEEEDLLNVRLAHYVLNIQIFKLTILL